VLRGVNGSLHLTVTSMNRLNQTETATFLILPFWTFCRGSNFLYLNILMPIIYIMNIQIISTQYFLLYGKGWAKIRVLKNFFPLICRFANTITCILLAIIDENGILQQHRNRNQCHSSYYPPNSENEIAPKYKFAKYIYIFKWN
jgi:hypothetical protein